MNRLASLSRKASNIRVIFEQFSLAKALLVLLSELFRMALDRYCIPSYSQTGEDRVAIALLGNKPGFYVDVGCNHPVKYSNTYQLYKKGWRGISIDANINHVSEHQRLRIKNTSIHAAVSSEERDVEFTIFEDSLVSSLNADHVEEYFWRQNRAIKSVCKLRTTNLTTLLEQNGCPNRFDLLSVDAEAHDYEVLISLDLRSFRPRLIIVEIHDFDILSPIKNKIYNYLLKNNYQLVGYLLMNCYFLDNQ